MSQYRQRVDIQTRECAFTLVFSAKSGCIGRKHLVWKWASKHAEIKAVIDIMYASTKYSRRTHTAYLFKTL